MVWSPATRTTRPGFSSPPTACSRTIGGPRSAAACWCSSTNRTHQPWYRRMIAPGCGTVIRWNAPCFCVPRARRATPAPLILPRGWHARTFILSGRSVTPRVVTSSIVMLATRSAHCRFGYDNGWAWRCVLAWKPNHRWLGRWPAWCSANGRRSRPRPVRCSSKRGPFTCLQSAGCMWVWSRCW